VKIKSSNSSLTRLLIADLWRRASRIALVAGVLCIRDVDLEFLNPVVVKVRSTAIA